MSVAKNLKRARELYLEVCTSNTSPIRSIETAATEDLGEENMGSAAIQMIFALHRVIHPAQRTLNDYFNQTKLTTEERISVFDRAIAAEEKKEHGQQEAKA